MIVSVIGLGLMGGSAAIDLRRRGFAQKLLGVDRNALHAEAALRLGLVDELLSLDDAVDAADLVLVAVPVDAAVELLPTILARVDRQVVTDLCSTKQQLAAAVKSHPRSKRYVGSHPMAGTENAGPWSALANLFDGKAVILCDTECCDVDAVETVESMYRCLYMRPIRMNAARHDLHAAYVSHISHVGSFALALTVLEKERDEQQLLDLASGGFSSTARLAKSTADMWTPIFLSNRDPVLEAIDTYIEKLQAFRDAIAANDSARITSLINDANHIRRILR